MVRALRSLWKDEAEPFQGKFYRWPKVESHRKPVQKPGVPIVVGGHTESRRPPRGALRRRLPFPASRGREAHALLAIIARVQEVDRDPATIEIRRPRRIPIPTA